MKELLKMAKISLFLLLVVFHCGSSVDVGLTAEKEKLRFKKVPIYEDFEDHQLDEYLNTMTIDEKIGQLFWMAAYSNRGQGEINTVKRMIRNYHVGGITWFRDTKQYSSPTTQLQYTNELQAESKYPLIFSIDGEWGLNMRLDSTVQFPRQLTLGAIHDNQSVYDFGKEVGRQMKRMGIHVNFAPVVDVNNNPNNPVINDRSFGENIYNVAEKGIAYMNGMHDSGILATAKHFPGHGDTDTDSHHDLPVINHNRNRLDSLELYPFKKLIESRIGLVMVAHLNIPALDPTVNRPTTLSQPVVTNLLQNELGFDGLIVTDAMNMQGVAKFYSNGNAEVEALKAGNDILLYSSDIPTAIQAIKSAVDRGEITEDRINKSVLKILSAKRWLGILDEAQQIPTQNLVADLTRPEVQLLNQKLYEKAVTLVKNNVQAIPFKDLSTKRIATVSIDAGGRNTFQNTLDRYAPMSHFALPSSASAAEYNSLLTKLDQYNTVIVGLTNKSSYARNSFGISSSAINFINQVNQQGKLILSVFGNPYSLSRFSSVNTLIAGYDDSYYAQKATAEAIFGVIPFQGKTPVGVPSIAQGTGLLTAGNNRLKFTIPEELGYTNDHFYQVDSIALDGIQLGAYPGCVVLVAKNNKVIYEKAYGYHTYKRKQKMETSDVFDLASITKITASMPAIMKAYEQGFLSTSQRMAELYPKLEQSNKSYMQVGEVLNHTSGLKSWIPFYRKTITKNGNLNGLYSQTPKDGFVQIADKMYFRESYERDSMLFQIMEAQNNRRGRYVYSDLGYYFFKDYIERIHNQDFDQYLDQSFYNRIGFKSLTYNPLNKFPKQKIVPTEIDDYWRHQTIQGYVHDMGAAMQGGVGGHAGLFGTAQDLATYMQLLLNKGSYGGVKYYEPTTIEYFTKRYNNNSRKALGFDKPELDKNKIGPTCEYVSPESFGHTGFTGTYVWADPYNEIIFVFLSNRTYPKATNNKLITNNIRPKMQEAVWRSLDPTCKSYY